ncbi:MAG: methyltransferase [Candidatus Omnitrophota bacterium]|nr:methyltransferase [Candidatus Omnitrophota bacterium]
MDLKEKEILGHYADSHWYYVSKELALRKFIKTIKFDNILDVGAGSGIFSRRLLMNSSAKEATCVDTAYITEREEEYFGKKINFKKNISYSDSNLALFMDVIEHVEDDVAFVKEYVNKINTGTYFVVTVPAFQFLFSGHDTFLGHYRRYTLSSIESCLNSAGLTVIKSNYFFFFITPFAIPIRILEKIKMKFFSNDFVAKSSLKSCEGFFNNILIKLNKLESPFFLINKFAGLSIFCLAVKE